MTKLKIILMLIFSLISTISVLGQDYSEEAKKYFKKYLSKKSQMRLLKKSLPSLEESKLIFKEKSAHTFFEYTKNMKKEFDIEENETFKDCRIESFTTCDILLGKRNYAGGMDDIKTHIQSNVIFYRVTYLEEKNKEHGLSYKYFVNIKGNWVFIPKPWRILNRTE